MLRAVLFGLTCLPLLSSCSSGCSTQAVVEQPPRPSQGCLAPRVLPEPQVELRVRVLTADTLVVVSDPNRFLRARVAADCAVGDPSLSSAAPGDWQYVLARRYAAKSTLASYRPGILAMVSSSEHLTIEGPGGRVHPASQSVWPQSLRELRLPEARETPDSVVTDSAELAYFSFVRLPFSMVRGARYVVSDRWGNSVDVTFDDAATTSWAIKVNQVGYHPTAAAKYGYVGAWLGPAGALDLGPLDGRRFRLLRLDGATAFVGVVRRRAEDRRFLGQPLYGETVMELDFSSVTERGEYRIAVDGVGVSFPFRIHESALGEAFYTHARGLYHARCGPLSKDHTGWPRGDAHTTTYRAGFPPDVEDYKDHTQEGWGFTDEIGNFAPHDSFQLVNLTATKEVLPGVRGGWHDAADFDRRTQHLGIVGDLAHAYLFYPENFTDRQLDLPESGNGVPDILDEAGWGLAPLLRGQASDGRVATWIEATSHPKVADPGADAQPYHLSLATRGSSLHYAAHAALHARALRRAGRDDDAAGWLESATRAYGFGTDPNVRVGISFAVGTERHTWVEPAQPDMTRHFFALTQLALASREPRWRAELDGMESVFTQQLAEMYWRGTSFSVADIALAADSFPAGWGNRAASTLVSVADRWLAEQSSDAYRKLWHDTSHPYFGLMGWGQAGFAPARFLVAAWRVTGDEKYRTGALLAVDWMSGTNPQGRVATTGLGRNFPVALLHLPSSIDGFDEPVPGITLFGYSANFPYSARSRVYGLFDPPRRDQAFPGLAQAALPPPWSDPALSSADIQDILVSNVPIWRRMTLLENQNPPMTEFSVHETIAPAVAITGCLLGPGWLPSPGQATRAPRTMAQLEDGFYYQP